MATGDLSWKGDGTKIQPGEQYWLNEAEKNKQGRNIVYTYGGKFGQYIGSAVRSTFLFSKHRDYECTKTLYLKCLLWNI